MPQLMPDPNLLAFKTNPQPHFQAMAGVGKLLKQAQKMQRKMEQVQEELAQKEINVSCGGGAVNIKINGQGEFLAISINPDFLNEDQEFVEETKTAFDLLRSGGVPGSPVATQIPIGTISEGDLSSRESRLDQQGN